MGPTRMGLVIADVSGKGLPAALFAAESSGILRALAAEREDASDVLNRANGHIAERAGTSGMFLTTFYAIVDTEQSVVRYASAGHNPPLVARTGRKGLDLLEATGMPLGIVEDARIVANVVDLHPGDTLICYTDGVTDARNERRELFGLERLKEVVETTAGRSASEIAETIREAIFAFAGGAPQADDVTVVVLKMV